MDTGEKCHSACGRALLVGGERCAQLGPLSPARSENVGCPEVVRIPTVVCPQVIHKLSTPLCRTCWPDQAANRPCACISAKSRPGDRPFVDKLSTACTPVRPLPMRHDRETTRHNADLSAPADPDLARLFGLRHSGPGSLLVLSPL